MSKLEYSFEVHGRPEVEVSIPSGDVSVHEVEGEAIDVVVSGRERDLAEIEVDQIGNRVTIQWRSSGRRRFSRRADVSIGMPPRGHAMLKTASGDVKVEVPMASVDVRVASGDVRVGPVTGSVRVKSASGDVRVDSAGEAQISTASGDIRVESIEDDLTAKTASGNIHVGVVGGDVTMKSAAGDLTIGRVDGDSVTATTVSGNVRLGLPPGLKVEANLRALSGTIRNELPEGSGEVRKHVRLAAKALSGDIVLRAADSVS